MEGPCCAGKTTLVGGLSHSLSGLRVEHVKCYADHAGGGRFLPEEVPATLAEDAQGLQTLLTIESDRISAARLQGSDIVLMDRSVHTLLSHRYALERVTGLSFFEPARMTLSQSRILVWPSLVLYLDVIQATVNDRNKNKFAAGSVLIDAGFNGAIRSYFANLTGRPLPRIAWLDATNDIPGLLETARAQVADYLQEVGT